TPCQFDHSRILPPDGPTCRSPQPIRRHHSFSGIHNRACKQRPAYGVPAGYG
ncbi:hypothetical protein M9458_048486, partial [Cirrhinus mrigala]